MATTDFLPALRALLPGLPDEHLYDTAADLDVVERDLGAAIADLVTTQTALRNARKARSAEHANTFIGEAFYTLIGHPGASGTAASNLERASIRLAGAQAQIRILDRFKPEA